MLQKNSTLLLPFFRFFSAILAFFLAFQPVYPAVAQIHQPPLPVTSSIQLKDEIFSPGFLACGNEIAPVINPDYEQAVVELVNNERADLNLPPLKRVEALDQAARYHSADLGMDDYFDHDTYDRVGDQLNFICLWWVRINNFYSSVRAENIAAGYQTPEAVVEAWMGSTGHRQNILSTNSDEIGVGYFEGEGSYNKYWTQDFGNRFDVYPVVINGEAARTDDRMVSLYIYGEWDEMRLRNDEDTWTTWQTFQNNIGWLLPTTNGEHQVTVEMRDETRTTTTSDTILLYNQSSEPELGNLSSAITFTYSIPAEQYFPEIAQQIPENIGSSDELVWEVSAQGSWFTVTPTIGTTPDAFMIVPDTLITPTLITTTGVITVSAHSSSGMLCTPHVMTLSIQIIDDQIQHVYIPLLTKLLP